MAKTDRARQQAYRKRMLENGYRQFAFWLDRETQAALKALKHVVDDLSTVASQAIKHYHAYKLSKTVSSNVKPVSSDVSRDSKSVSSNVTSNVSSNKKEVSSDVTKNATSHRYMTPELEDYILELRQSGMTLQAIANRLASDGYRNAKGEPYGTGTISKAEKRVRQRRG